jgi:hypothetical protein
VSSRWYAKSYLDGVTGSLQDQYEFVYETVQNENRAKLRTVQNDWRRQTLRYCGQREYLRNRGFLRIIQDQECRAEKIKSK